MEPYGIGLKFSPPSLFVFYNSENGKRRRKIPLRTIHCVLKTNKEKPFDLDSYQSFLVSNYSQHLRSISRMQLQKILQIVLTHHKIQVAASAAFSSGNSSSMKEDKGNNLPDLPLKSIDLERNLNKATDEELDQIKRAMDADFEKNRITKDSANFEYDIKKDFGKPTMKNEWDSSDEDSSAPPQKSSVTTEEPPSQTKEPIKQDQLAASERINTNSSNLAPIKSSISKKQIKSLADDLDSLLDSLEKPEKENPKKNSKKVTIISDKEDGNDKKLPSSQPSQKSATKTDPIQPDTTKLEPKTGKKLESNLEKNSDILLKKSDIPPKSLLGGLPPLTSLSELPPLNGPKSLPISSIIESSKNLNPLAFEIGGAKNLNPLSPDTRSPKNLNSLPSKTAENILPLSEKVGELQNLNAAPSGIPAPRNSSTDHNVPAPKTNEESTRVIQADKFSIKSAVNDVIEDDISEEIIAECEDEDEEFAHLRKKLFEASQSKQTSAEGESISKTTVMNDSKENKALLPDHSTPKDANTPHAIKPSTLVLAPLNVPPNISKPVQEAISIDKTISSKSSYDYEDDFEAGHTDDEIVFSDDGLSIGSVEKDDLF